MGTDRAVAQSRISRADNGVMLDIFQNFEGSAARLSPLVLIGSGAAAAAIGLLVWLGGLRFKRVLVAVAGAVCGGLLGFLVVRRGPVVSGVLAAVAAAVAVISERVSIALLAGALGASVSFVVLAGLTLGRSQTTNPAGREETAPQTGAVSSGEALEQLKAYAVDAGEAVKRAASQMPMYTWAIIATAMIVLMAGTFIFSRLVSALCFSLLGTMLVFVGMILLLLYKEAAPISRISRGPQIYAGVLAAMTAFGTLEQLVLCRAARTQTQRKRRTSQEEEGTEKKPRRRWMT